MIFMDGAEAPEGKTQAQLMADRPGSVKYAYVQGTPRRALPDEAGHGPHSAHSGAGEDMRHALLFGRFGIGTAIRGGKTAGNKESSNARIIADLDTRQRAVTHGKNAIVRNCHAGRIRETLPRDAIDRPRRLAEIDDLAAEFR